MASLRSLGVGDIDAVDPLLMEAYNNPKSYRPRLLRLLDLGPADWLLAERDGLPVGMGGITVMGRVAYVGLVAVRLACQGQGIATRLMGKLLSLARERGCDTVLLDASPAGRPLYEKLGFVVEDGVDLWKRPAPGPDPHPAAGEGILVSTLEVENRENGLAPEFVPGELGGFDTRAIGWDRSRVLASFVMDDPGLVALARDREGRLRGYAIVQPDYGVLGPWVAVDKLAATALLRWALTEAGCQPGIAHVPAANKEAALALTLAGFSLVRSNTHMRLGTALPATGRQRVFSQASFALG